MSNLTNKYFINNLEKQMAGVTEYLQKYTKAYEKFYGEESFSFKVPNFVNKIYVSAIGAGGGGASGGAGGSSGYVYESAGAGGGSGGHGEEIFDQEISVEPGAVLSIFLGGGGAGGQAVSQRYTQGNPGQSGGRTYITIGNIEIFSVNPGTGGIGGEGGSKNKAECVLRTGGAGGSVDGNKGGDVPQEGYERGGSTPGAGGLQANSLHFGGNGFGGAGGKGGRASSYNSEVISSPGQAGGRGAIVICMGAARFIDVEWEEEEEEEEE